MNMHVRLFKTIFVTLLVLAVGLGDVENDEDDVQVEVDIEEDSKSGSEIPYTSPQISQPDRVYFAEHFDDLEQFEKKWIKSQAVKEGISEDIAKYNGEWKVEAPLRDGLIGDKGLVLKTHAKHAAISSHLTKPFVFDQKPLIVQYEVTLQDGQQCGGAYLKLLSQGPQTSNLKQFQDKTPYTIMFGPDKCGGDYKLHFIFNHRNPINGSLQEKHCKKSNERLEDLINDKWPHLYTLIINPDNSFQILIDNKLVNSGSLLEDFSPAVNPPAEVDDPNDKKPEDWDEREKIPDPEATKPEDWDEDAPSQIVDESATVPDGWLENEPAHISDPDAIRPADWDTDMDGEWEAPLIDNPACVNAVGCGPWEPPLINNPAFKGKWRASLIDNPNYKGKWRPRTIANPDYFEDLTPFKMTTVSAIGFELWSMSRDMLFDNILITDEIEVASQWAADSFDKKRQKIAKDSDSMWGRLLKVTNYKPGWWGLYFLYCLIPVVIYIGYLYFCVMEESVIEKLASLTVDYPALWGVYILVLAVPVVFILYLCFKPGSPSTPPQEQKEDLIREAEKKKTDEVTEDVQEDTQEVEEASAEAEVEEADEDDKDEVEVETTEETLSDSSQPQSSQESTRKRKVRKE